MIDPVEAQIEAFNRGALEAFLACYDEKYVTEDRDGAILDNGIDGLRNTVGTLFAQSPDLHVEVKGELRLGPFVVYDELTTGVHMEGRPTEVRCLAVYRVEDGKVVQM